MLTPYQFASNRPIDGIDQDGLEFVKYRAWDQDYDKGGVAAVFANVTANTVIGAVNGVAGAAVGVKDLAVYGVRVQMGQRNVSADAVKLYNGLSSSLNRFIAKPINEQIKLLTSPEAYGALVGFFALGGAKFTKGSTLTSTINDAYEAKTFAKVIENAKDITKGGSTPNVLVDGSVSEAFGGIMKQYGKTADDLLVNKTKNGFAYTFTEGNETFTLYHQTSKADNIVDLTITRTLTLENGAKKTTKARFTKD